MILVAENIKLELLLEKLSFHVPKGPIRHENSAVHDVFIFITFN